MTSHDSHPTACTEFVESRLQRIEKLSLLILKTSNCVAPSGHVGEVVNEVYIKVEESWDSLRSPDDALNTIAANAARTHARKCRREPPQEVDEAAIPWLSMGAQDPAAIYEQAILIEEYLDQLCEEDQLLIHLLFEGWKFDEIEVLTGTPSGTLRSRYSRAVKKLRRVALRPVGDLDRTRAVATTD